MENKVTSEDGTVTYVIRKNIVEINPEDLNLPRGGPPPLSDPPGQGQTDDPTPNEVVVPQLRSITDYDDILLRIGEFGRRQKCLFIWLCLPSAAAAMAVFMYEFIAYTPNNYRCYIPGCDLPKNDSLFPEPPEYDTYFVPYSLPRTKEDFENGHKYAQCESLQKVMNPGNECTAAIFKGNERESCQNGYVYDRSILESSATMDFDMVCENGYKKASAQSIYMLGMLVGSFIFGYLSDLIGRRTTLMLTSILLAGAGTVSALLPADPANWPFFALMRFFSGTGHVGVFITAFSLTVEYVGPNWRTFVGCLIEVAFALGGLIVGLLAWAGVRDWRMLQIVCSAPWIMFIFFFCVIPESPRWLLSKGKFDQLRKDIQKTADANNKRFPESTFAELVRNYQEEKKVLEAAIDKGDDSTVVRKEVGLINLFLPIQIGIRTINMFFNWLVITLCYYGLTSTASNLSENIFLNYCLAILVEIPANFFCIKVLNIWGRKPILSFCQILAGVSCIIAGFVASIPWLQITLSLIGKFGSTCCFTIVYIYTSEMFPTEIRSTAVGSSSTSARVGGMLAPVVASTGDLTGWAPLPLIIMGGMSLVAGFLAFVNLPETLGEKLPESVEEALNLGKKKKKPGSLSI